MFIWLHLWFFMGFHIVAYSSFICVEDTWYDCFPFFSLLRLGRLPPIWKQKKAQQLTEKLLIIGEEEYYQTVELFSGFMRTQNSKQTWKGLHQSNKNLQMELTILDHETRMNQSQQSSHTEHLWSPNEVVVLN